jgi:hypothetical protein
VPFQVGKLWKARVEPKVKVFTWTTMHKRILTTDNLVSRGIQHNPLCLLCSCHPEDTGHLLIDCPFAKEVIKFLWSRFHFQGTLTGGYSNLDPTSWLATNVARANVGDLRLRLSPADSAKRSAKRATPPYDIQITVFSLHPLWLVASLHPPHAPGPGGSGGRFFFMHWGGKLLETSSFVHVGPTYTTA